MVMVSDIIKAGLHHCTGGVAFRKVTDCMRLQFVRNPYKFKSREKSGSRWWMLKIRVSALKSAGWNFTKFG